ncbi:ATP-binding protein [Priestia filamentosa]|uniref:ATP-binding protein n=1 Tax=Priestia filamentosa TaxID=1402861 RepID=UPI003F181BCC
MLNINTIHTYLQIVQNSREPLEVIREAIANAYDSGASEIKITVKYIKDDGSINITFEDNGCGLLKEEIEKYIFGLGHSMKINNDTYIGNKGVGTLLYLKSKSVTVTTFKDGKGAKQEWVDPYRTLLKYRNSFSTNEVDVGIKGPIDIQFNGQKNGTTIEIKGFLHDNPIEYHHENLGDFILWFTKAASFENKLNSHANRKFKVELKGLIFTEHSNNSSLIDPYDTGNETFIEKGEIITRKKSDSINTGFLFPPTSIKEELINNEILMECEEKDLVKEIKKLLVLKYTSGDDQFTEDGLNFDYKDSLGNSQKARIDFVVYRIGETIRYEHNKMMKRNSNTLPSYKYSVTERHGIYLAKNFIPVQQINSTIPSIGGGGNGKWQYLGFFNCESIDLTIDRSGAATIDGELQIKLFKTIKHLLLKIDKRVNEEIDDILEKVKLLRVERHSANPALEDSQGDNNNGDNSGNGEFENLKEKNEDNTDDGNNKIPDDTGKNLTTEVKKLEVQKKKTKKAQRIHKIKLKKALTVTTNSGDVILREPNNESELFGILMQVMTLKPNIFDFNILDYNTSNGIDILARDKNQREDDFDNLYYIELKEKLTPKMNHLLDDVEYIICWNVDASLERDLLLMDKYQCRYTLDSQGSNYILKRENSAKIVRVIELKDLVEKHFGQLTIVATSATR